VVVVVGVLVLLSLLSVFRYRGRKSAACTTPSPLCGIEPSGATSSWNLTRYTSSHIAVHPYARGSAIIDFSVV